MALYRKLAARPVKIVTENGCIAMRRGEHDSELYFGLVAGSVCRNDYKRWITHKRVLAIRNLPEGP